MKKASQPITGIVLAGGKSSRMGQDKGLLPLQGKPMVQWVLDALTPCVDHIIIVANEPAYAQLGYPTATDLIANAGPAGGIYTGLKASETALNFIVSCDMPFIRPEAICFLLEQAEDTAITLPMAAGRLQPLFGVYAKSCASGFEQQIRMGRLKLQLLVKQFRLKCVAMDAQLQRYPHLFQNINTRQEFTLAINESHSWK